MGRLKVYGLLLHLASKGRPRSSSIPPRPCQNLNFRMVIPFSFPGRIQFSNFSRVFSSIPYSSSAAAAASSSSSSSSFADDSDYGYRDYGRNNCGESQDEVEEESAIIPVKAYFLSTSIDLKSMQSELAMNVIPPASRASNYILFRFFEIHSKMNEFGEYENVHCTQYMVIFQFGSAVLFNVKDHEADSFLNIVRRHASGSLQEMRRDDYAVKEQPKMADDMQGRPDYIVLKHLDADAIRIIGNVLGQSIALDYFVSQVDGMVEEFAEINRGMMKTGTFTMKRKKLFQLVGKANTNLADIILKVGLFDRSEIAWREAKYAQINEYMREEYEVTQRFGNLDFKLKFVEHNIHFLQEVLQNRKSDLLEWCVIYLLSIQNVISIYEIVRDSSAGSV